MILINLANNNIILLTAGDLIEGIVLHVFDGKVPFSDEFLKKIKELKSVYNLELTWEDSHKLQE